MRVCTKSQHVSMSAHALHIPTLTASNARTGRVRRRAYVCLSNPAALKFLQQPTQHMHTHTHTHTLTF